MNKQFFHRQITFRLKMVLSFVLLIGFVIVICLVMNRTFLLGYYENYKIKSLENVYNEATTIYSSMEKDGESVEESSMQMESLMNKKAMNAYIFRFETNVEGQVPIRFLYPAMDVFQQFQIWQHIQSYLVGDIAQESEAESAKPRRKKELIVNSDKFFIYKVYDEAMESNFLELIGTIDDTTLIYIRSNYQGIEDSTDISNEFLLYVGIGAMFFGILLMLIISRRFTKPVLELSRIAEKMAGLDFDVKYNHGNRKDEIGILGNSMNRLSDTLKQTISELKSANNELQQDLEKKEQIEELRTEFLSNVSHELKTPIALIQGYAEGLADNVNDDEESRNFYCEVIVDEANKMNQMVKKLLDLNQLEFGNDKVEFERFDIVEMIRANISSNRILWEQKDIKVIFENQAPIYVWSDEYRVEEVINNYLSNARNHIDGERIIRINVERREGDIVRVSVSNTGQPIPEESLTKLWEKFYKVDKARTREYGGSGIGLSIVKAIMDSLNQNYGVENTEDGVCFWFELDGSDSI
ncbi:MAG: HAMP domain-containing histidine kinase [Lachnospiraceae bacterium]|nr:HAMP domain-containing histidine kinase [Lachnospiraceae bacterium]